MALQGRPRIIDEVLHRLLLKLADGTWSPGEAMPSSRRLAALFGVSQVTMRAALAEASRQKLLDVRQRRPTVVRRGAATRAAQLIAERATQRRTEHVALLLPEQYFPLTRNTIYMLLTTALERELKRQGFSRVSIVRWTMAECVAMARSLPHKGVDAAIVIGSQSMHVSLLCLLYEQGFPFVMFNRQIPGVNLPSVMIDRPSVTADIARRLIALGHRNLCMVLYASGNATRESDRGQELQAWMNCLKEAEVFDECHMPAYFAYSLNRETFMPCFIDLMHGPRRPTAVVFEEYQWAAAFLADPRLADLRVPEQLSLAMLGTTRKVPSTPWCPPLATAEMDYNRTAQCLVETLIRVLSGKTGSPSIRLPLTISMTDSIGRAPAIGKDGGSPGKF